MSLQRNSTTLADIFFPPFFCRSLFLFSCPSSSHSHSHPLPFHSPLSLSPSHSAPLSHSASPLLSFSFPLLLISLASSSSLFPPPLSLPLSLLTFFRPVTNPPPLPPPHSLLTRTHSHLHNTLTTIAFALIHPVITLCHEVNIPSLLSPQHIQTKNTQSHPCYFVPVLHSLFHRLLSVCLSVWSATTKGLGPLDPVSHKLHSLAFYIFWLLFSFSSSLPFPSFFLLPSSFFFLSLFSSFPSTQPRELRLFICPEPIQRLQHTKIIILVL